METSPWHSQILTFLEASIASFPVVFGLLTVKIIIKITRGSSQYSINTGILTVYCLYFLLSIHQCPIVETLEDTAYCERSTTSRVTYWISYASRVTVWGFQLGSIDRVFVVPIFGGTVSGYYAQPSTLMSVLSFILSTNLSSTRYETSR